MNNLIDAIKAKYAGSTLESDVNGRIDLDESSDMTLPRIVWFVVSGSPDDVFAKKGSQVLIQFSIFVALTAGIAAMTTIYNDLHTLFDECDLTITGNTLAIMKETNLTPIIEDDTTTEGAPGIRHYAVDFEVATQKT
jgi:hypothetical protein